jgi:hypothetical protein
MSNQNETNQYLLYIVAVIAIAFMIYVWYTNRPKHMPTNNYIYSQHEPINPYNIGIQHFQPTPEINTESMVLGSHNSAHSSPIIASPFNPIVKS